MTHFRLCLLETQVLGDRPTLTERSCFRAQPKRMSGTDYLTKNPQPPERATRKNRRRAWYIRRSALNRIIIQMILDHYQAVRMSRIRDPHWRPLITTDNFVPGAALDLEDQDQGGEMDR